MAEDVTKFKNLEVESLTVKSPNSDGGIYIRAANDGSGATGIWVQSADFNSPFAAIYIDPNTQNPVIQLMDPKNTNKLHGADLAISLEKDGTVSLQYSDGKGGLKIFPIHKLGTSE